MRIALDFDGVIVDKKDSSVLDYDWSKISKNNIIDVVTARDPISYFFVKRILKENNIKVDNIICCNDNIEKIKVLKKGNYYDVIIDNDYSILKEDYLAIKILFGQKFSSKGAKFEDGILKVEFG